MPSDGILDIYFRPIRGSNYPIKLSLSVYPFKKIVRFQIPYFPSISMTLIQNHRHNSPAIFRQNSLANIVL